MVQATSIAALAATDTAALRAQVLRVLRQNRSGLTDDQGGDILWPKDRDRRLKFGRRRHELVEMGLAEDSGKKFRKQNNREVIVWRYVPPAKRVAKPVLTPAEQRRADMAADLSRTLTKKAAIDQLVDLLIAQQDAANPAAA